MQQELTDTHTWYGRELDIVAVTRHGADTPSGNTWKEGLSSVGK